jgi:hypothetical protein
LKVHSSSCLAEGREARGRGAIEDVKSQERKQMIALFGNASSEAFLGRIAELELKEVISPVPWEKRNGASFS